MMETTMGSKTGGSAGADNPHLPSDLEMIEKFSRRLADTVLETYNDASPDHKNPLMLGLFREAKSLATGALFSTRGLALSEKHVEPTQYNFQKLIKIARNVEMLLGYPEGFFEK